MSVSSCGRIPESVIGAGRRGITVDRGVGRSFGATTRGTVTASEIAIFEADARKGSGAFGTFAFCSSSLTWGILAPRLVCSARAELATRSHEVP